MIVLICIVCIVLIIALWAASGECQHPAGVVASFPVIAFLIISLIAFHSSSYQSWKDQEYLVHIAPNNSAYIYLGNYTLNVNCYFEKNFKDGDVITVRYYDGYWVGYIYVDSKREFFIGEPGD